VPASEGYLSYAAQLPGLEDRDPYCRPTSYVQKDPATGNLVVIGERRPSSMLLVGALRDAVDAWRQSKYEGASSTTRRIFKWWFEEAESSGFRPYWGQREAVETLAYLVEVAQIPDTIPLIQTYNRETAPDLINPAVDFRDRPGGGRELIRNRDSGRQEIVELPSEGLRRYAFKMATGSGKTLVMAMCATWAYFHSRREDDSPLVPNFLVIAPNVIVFERLRVDFGNGFVFHNLPLVPPPWTLDLRVILRGDPTEPVAYGNIFVTNIHQLYEGGGGWTASSAIDKLLGRKPSGDANAARRMLDRVRSLDGVIVMNDEAHHVHDSELEWNKTLVELNDSLPRRLPLWLDFSATPKYQTGSYFPWVVCDYPLAQAVEDRIVKTPIILHMVNKPDPEHITRNNVIDKYRDWLVAGVERCASRRPHMKKSA
jgi:type III restriction enzyme